MFFLNRLNLFPSIKTLVLLIFSRIPQMLLLVNNYYSYHKIDEVKVNTLEIPA